MWHWWHLQETGCDSWNEGETQWHWAWKSKFPADWQEVLMEVSGEKHIADVPISSGPFIEFQNSSISTKTIREREEFYQDLI